MDGRLCKDCIHCKSKMVGYVSSVSWCDISKKNKNGEKLGVNPWYGRPHPKCPIKRGKKYE